MVPGPLMIYQVTKCMSYVQTGARARALGTSLNGAFVCIASATRG